MKPRKKSKSILACGSYTIRSSLNLSVYIYIYIRFNFVQRPPRIPLIQNRWLRLGQNITSLKNSATDLSRMRVCV